MELLGHYLVDSLSSGNKVLQLVPNNRGLDHLLVKSNHCCLVVFSDHNRGWERHY